MDRRFGPRVREDVAVPVERVDELLAFVDSLAKENEVPVYVYGHVGDGNLHPNFVTDPLGSVAESIRSRLMDQTRQMGGTISGEHGIGKLKSQYLEHEIGPVAVSMLAALKRRCDPSGILNPGTLFPPSESTA